MQNLIIRVACVALLGSMGCGSDNESATGERAQPIRVALGDCAGPTARFESGPRPQPFDIDEVEKDMASLLATLDERRSELASSADGSPEKAEQAGAERDRAEGSDAGDSSLESGGTGTRMALSEGKMGKKESEGKAGRFRMKQGDESFPRARKKALEQTRNAGIASEMVSSEHGFASLTGQGDFSSGFDDRDIYGGLLDDEEIEWKPGPGGPSGHTIAPGRGGMRGRRLAKPAVRIGKPIVNGNLDEKIIHRYVRRKLNRIKYCYEKELLVKPGLSGAIIAQLQISPKGTVLNSTAKGMGENVATCVASVLKTTQFPRPRGGGLVQVRYPFTFRPSSSLPEKAKPETAPGSAESPADTPTTSPAASKEAVTPPPSASKVEPADRYVPGATSPLAPYKSELEACFRRAGKDYGVMFVEMAIDAQGAVSSAKSVGLDDEKATKCIVEVARKAKFQAPKVSAYRCPIAFGTMPTDRATTIDISAHDIRLGFERVVGIETIVEDQTPQWKIFELFERLRKRARSYHLGYGLEPIAITGPEIIRPVDATPMKVVERVLMTARAAGIDNWVLAARQGDGWRLLKPGLILPAVPVPLSTGGRWPYIEPVSRSVHVAALDEQPVRVSVLATDSDIWVGLSQGDDFRKIPRNDAVYKELESILAEHRKSRFLSGRRDIEISGEDHVTYEVIVGIIDIAHRVGFTDWAIARPAALSARPVR